jgi:hypothetical protein
MAKNPSPTATKKTPLVKKPLSPAGTDATSGSDSFGIPKKKTTPLSPQSHGLGADGGVPTRGDSSQPRGENLPQSSLRVADSLAKDLDFIKAGFHIGRFVTAAVNTEAERLISRCYGATWILPPCELM